MHVGNHYNYLIKTHVRLNCDISGTSPCRPEAETAGLDSGQRGALQRWKRSR